VNRPGEGEGSLHLYLYHGSIWLRPGCDLELSSFEIPVQANKSERFCRCRVLLCSLSQANREAATLSPLRGWLLIRWGANPIRGDCPLSSSKLQTTTLLLRTRA